MNSIPKAAHIYKSAMREDKRPHTSPSQTKDDTGKFSFQKRQESFHEVLARQLKKQKL